MIVSTIRQRISGARRRVFATAVASLAFADISPAAQQQFTLECSGEIRTFDSKPRTISQTFTFEVAGDTGRYYDFDGAEWRKLSGVSEDVLVLQEMHEKKTVLSHKIVRRTGKWEFDWYERGEFMHSIRGKCAKTAYQSPPPPRF